MRVSCLQTSFKATRKSWNSGVLGQERNVRWVINSELVRHRIRLKVALQREGVAPLSGTSTCARQTKTRVTLPVTRSTCGGTMSISSSNTAPTATVFP